MTIYQFYVEDVRSLMISGQVFFRYWVLILFLCNDNEVTTKGKHRTYLNKKQAIYHQNHISELEHNVCFPFVILKIYWLKRMSHDYLCQRMLRIPLFLKYVDSLPRLLRYLLKRNLRDNPWIAFFFILNKLIN